MLDDEYILALVPDPYLTWQERVELAEQRDKDAAEQLLQSWIENGDWMKNDPEWIGFSYN